MAESAPLPNPSAAGSGTPYAPASLGGWNGLRYSVNHLTPTRLRSADTFTTQAERALRGLVWRKR